MFSIRSSRWLAVFGLACAYTVVAGCASAPIDGSTRARYTRTNPTAARRGFITTDELRKAHATSTADMIRTLRPEFLRSSSRAANPLSAIGPAVIVDRSYLGDLSWLSVIPLSEVRQVEFVHPAEARVRFGSLCGCEGGVIVFQMASPASR
jgi:hypothetical protein